MERDPHAQTQTSGDYTLETVDLYARRAECARLRSVILNDLSRHTATTISRIRDLAGVTYQRAQRELVEMVQEGTLDCHIFESAVDAHGTEQSVDWVSYANNPKKRATHFTAPRPTERSRFRPGVPARTGVGLALFFRSDV